MKIMIYSLIDSTKALGPYDRYGLWTQGCHFNCPSCMTPDSHDMNAGISYSIDEITNMILSQPQNEGLTISGGEPFLQINPLFELIKLLKSKKNIGIIIYTGFLLEELKMKFSIMDEFLKYVDILIDGQYEDNKNNNTALRGSSNQRVHLLSSRYENVYKKHYESSVRNIEVHFTQEYPIIVGIPKKGTLEMIKKKLQKDKNEHR